MRDLATLLLEFLPGRGHIARGGTRGECDNDGLKLVCREGTEDKGEGCEDRGEDAHLDG